MLMNLFFSAPPLVAELEVGHHLYWHLGKFTVHGQVLIASWIAIALILTVVLLGTRQLQREPAGLQNFIEYTLEFVQSIARAQIGEKNFRPWVPYVGT
jgi:F-type H+-transporting ATPase subunit a